MDSKCEKLVRELKEVELAIHRLASNLDDIIQYIESNSEEYTDDEEFEMLVNYQGALRKESQEYFAGIIAVERNAWNEYKNLSYLRK
jgi:hypothetical protein